MFTETRRQLARVEALREIGVGIPGDARELIFDKFSQLDGSATRGHEGIGLGLLLGREFVDLLGGEITVESEVEVGSTFKLSVPVDINSLSLSEVR